MGGTRTAIAFALGAILTGSIAFAADSSPGQIDGCVAATGHLRVITSGSCLPAETPLSWNKVGPQGPAGPQGPQGEPGPQGPAGPAGGHLHYAAAPASTTVSASDHGLTPVPGTTVSIDVAEGDLVAVGGYADATLDKGSCSIAVGDVMIVDQGANAGSTMDNVTSVSTGWPPPGGGTGQTPPPPSTFMKRKGAAKRHAPRQASGGGTSTVHGTLLGSYRLLEPGHHDIGLADEIQGADCQDATLTSSNHKLWVNVLHPGDA